MAWVMAHQTSILICPHLDSLKYECLYTIYVNALLIACLTETSLHPTCPFYLPCHGTVSASVISSHSSGVLPGGTGHVQGTVNVSECLKSGNILRASTDEMDMQLIVDIDTIHICTSFNSKWTTNFYAQLNFSEMHFKLHQSLTLKETVTVTWAYLNATEDFGSVWRSKRHRRWQEKARAWFWQLSVVLLM